MLIYIQEVIWMEDQGEGTSLRCTLYFSYLELLLAFHYDWENETILPGALRHFKWYQTCMVTFLYILHCMGFSVNSRWWGAVQGVGPPGVLRGGRWWDRQEIVPVDFRRAFCPLEGGGGRHTGTRLNIYIYIYIYMYIHFLQYTFVINI